MFTRLASQASAAPARISKSAAVRIGQQPPSRHERGLIRRASLSEIFTIFPPNMMDSDIQTRDDVHSFSFQFLAPAKPRSSVTIVSSGGPSVCARFGRRVGNAGEPHLWLSRASWSRWSHGPDDAGTPATPIASPACTNALAALAPACSCVDDPGASGRRRFTTAAMQFRIGFGYGGLARSASQCARPEHRSQFLWRTAAIGVPV